MNNLVPLFYINKLLDHLSLCPGEEVSSNRELYAMGKKFVGGGGETGHLFHVTFEIYESRKL